MADNGIVVVFDFDKTIIECDSDNWVVDELGFTDLFNQLLPTMPWNSLMDRMMKEVHEQGKSIEDIVEVLKSTPIDPKVVPAIKAARALGCDLKIISDANMFFIETILEHLGLKHCFSEIVTNPGFVDEQGRLRILPFHDFNNCSHGCTGLCPPNMCKGVILGRIQSSIPNKRLIYLGDGIGDYCPGLKLEGKDFFMPRKNFPVWDLISKNPQLIKAETHAWTNGKEFMKTLLSLIDTISIEEQALSLPTDCKAPNNCSASVFAFCSQLSHRPPLCRSVIASSEVLPIYKPKLRIRWPNLVVLPSFLSGSRNKFCTPVFMFHNYACIR